MGAEPADGGAAGPARRVLFLGINASYSHTSLAAWYLSTVLDPRRWSCDTLNVTLADDPHDLLAAVLERRPDVLAVSIYLFNRLFVEEWLARFRALSPQTRVIAGGPDLLGDCRALFTPRSLVDVAVRGEGERAFARLMDAADRPGEWPAIPGLCFMRGGDYVDTGEAESPEPDEIPSPYAACLRRFHRPFVQVETSRGCASRCIFCTSGRGGRVRFFPLERVERDLRAIRDAGIREVRVVDRTFNMREERCLDLLELFRGQFPELRFHLEVDPGLVTDAEIESLARGGPGQFHVEVGVQSLNPGVGQAVRRRAVSSERVLDAVRRLGALSAVDVHADLIAALPGATLDDTYDDLARLAEAGPVEIQLEILKVLPGTALAGEAGRLGVVYAPRPPYEVLATGRMAVDEVRAAARLSRAVDAFYNAAALHAVTRAAGASCPDFWRGLGARMPVRGGGAGLSLDRRFAIMRECLESCRPRVMPALADAWVRADIGLEPAVFPARPWKAPLPAGAELVEGSADASLCRQVWLEHEGGRFVYGFAFSGGRRRVAAVFRLP